MLRRWARRITGACFQRFDKLACMGGLMLAFYKVTRLGGIIRVLTVASILGGLFLASVPQTFAAGNVIPLSRKDKKELAVLGEGVVGEAIEAPVITDPAKYYRPIPGKWKYRITSGDNKDQVFTETVSQIPKNAQGATWKRSRDKYDDLFSVTDNTIYLSNEIDHQHGYLVQFTPTGHLLSAALKPGESKKMKSTVHVFKISDPKTEYKTLKMEETYTYVGAYKVTTPAGVFDTVLFRNDFKVFAGPVTVDDFRYAFYAKGVGKVAGIEHGHAVVMLIFHFNDKIPKVLVDYPRSGN